MLLQLEKLLQLLQMHLSLPLQLQLMVLLTPSMPGVPMHRPTLMTSSPSLSSRPEMTSTSKLETLRPSGPLLALSLQFPETSKTLTSFSLALPPSPPPPASLSPPSSSELDYLFKSRKSLTSSSS